MNDAAGELLRTISGGRVLDVATGGGAFIHTLIGGLQDWTEVIGIDSDETNREAFSEAFEDTPGVRYTSRSTIGARRWIACRQVHRETYRRAKLVSLLRGLRLDELRTVDVSETSEDPKTDGTLNAIDGIIDRYLERATGHARLRARGETVRRRLHEVGIHGATALLAVGRKSPVGRP